ncbi:LysR family transcriptional regulator [Candidatus Halocynthiibacter alkanivorans]|uniref:LysR family transcriptional regulator n=1 Tax=Candidatus Halocynthiibacter alkanivorans TaxID=2267619 RepID=UPI000DF4178D|nr:LysR family transcriptional regulator [Candidatus Halocynthiibacter alkanivorans]
MIAPRRFLPSISSLRALEALERLGSATAVAQELDLTQSAVSRQLQVLEGQMGVTLIIREKKRLHLTPAARQYAQEVRKALQQIAQASLKLRANPGGGSLNLAILPTFGMRWLVPRLADFARSHPEITINMATRLAPFDFDSEGFDAALHFGTTDWPGAGHMKLKTEYVIPVCAPELLRSVTLRGPGDLCRLPLLHIETRPSAWENWMAANGVEPGPLTGTLYDQFSTITQAAVHGLGVALLPDYLVERELSDGRLVRAMQGPAVSLGDYYLVWPVDKAADPALNFFCDWLKQQINVEDMLPR